MEVNIGLPAESNDYSSGTREDMRPFSLYNSNTHVGREIWMIVSAGSDDAIGRGGDLIWKLPGDLPRFKTLTMGHPVIMGRLTFESLPKGALPGRRNIVISSRRDYTPAGAERNNNLVEAIAATEPMEIPFIIGGGKVYAEAIPYATRLYITRVDAPCPDADTYFPAINPDEWECVERSDDMHTSEGISYRFEEWHRRK